MATTSPAGPARRSTPPRGNKNLAVIVGIAVLVVLAIALIAFVGCSGDDKKNPAAGTTDAINSASVLLTKALGEIQNGDLNGAKADLEQVKALDPNNKFAFYNLGYIQQTQGDKGDAETNYKAAIELDKKFDSALYNLAILRAGNDDIDGAITLYRQAIGANPNNANAHFNLGLLLRQSGKTAEGNTQVQMAVRLSPSLATAASAQGVPTGG